MAEKEDLDQEDQVPTEELWERWQESGEEEVKMLLVERYQPLVGFIAARMVASPPARWMCTTSFRKAISA